MSEIKSHIYTCDNCGHSEDVKFKGELPNNWSRVELKTIEGIIIYSSIDLCKDCGYNQGLWHSDRNRTKNKSILLKLLNKFKGLKNDK